MAVTTPAPPEPQNALFDLTVSPMAAPPPIQARSTYPPGAPSLGWPPKTFGKTPVNAAQIMTPGAQPTTHFSGPVVSGPAPGIGAMGAAQLTLCLQLDYSMGNFSVPVSFPNGSFLQSLNAATYAAGLPSSPLTLIVTLGTQTGLADIAAALTLPATGAVVAPVLPAAQLPLWDAVSPLVPFQMWLNVAGNTGATAGGAVIMVNYLRIPGPWSGPAK
jgi:hypothetical protein